MFRNCKKGGFGRLVGRFIKHRARATVRKRMQWCPCAINHFLKAELGADGWRRTVRHTIHRNGAIRTRVRRQADTIDDGDRSQPRTGATVSITWRMHLTTGGEVDRAQTPPYQYQNYPVTVTRTID
jgi:hypothetical protein